MRHLRYPEAPRQPEKAVTCGENQAARNQTVDAPSVRQLNARWKTPVHAHGASNHTMDTTGTCNPQKLRWYALTWKPTANGEHPTPTKQAMCHNSSDAAQKTRTQQQIWSTNPHIKKHFLPLGKHNFVTNELRTLPKTHRTRNMRHMRKKKKKQRQSFTEDKHSSRHTCAQQRCERTCASCSKLATRGTQMDARNRNRRHERCSRAPQHDTSLESGSLRQPPHEPPRRNTTSDHQKKNTMEKEPNVACFRPAPRPCVCTYLPKWRVRAQSERARRKTAHDRAPAHLLPHATTNTEMLKQTNKERKATQDVTAPRRKLWYVGMTRTHKRIRTLNFDAPAWLGRPIHTHRASSKQS